MTAWAPGATPLQDGDAAWKAYEGAVRVRVAGGRVQLQISVDNGDGTFDITTVELSGSVRDTRKRSTTKWPSYNAAGLPTNFVTDSQHQDRLRQQAQAKGRVTVPDGPPVSGGTGK